MSTLATTCWRSAPGSAPPRACWRASRLPRAGAAVRTGPPGPMDAGSEARPQYLSGARHPPPRRELAQTLVLDHPLELLEALPQVIGHGGCGDPLGEPAEQPRAGDAVGEAQLDPSPAARGLAQAPPTTLV